jgi:hypothetical protein
MSSDGQSLGRRQRQLMRAQANRNKPIASWTNIKDHRHSSSKLAQLLSASGAELRRAARPIIRQTGSAIGGEAGEWEIVTLTYLTDCGNLSHPHTLRRHGIFR